MHVCIYEIRESEPAKEVRICCAGLLKIPLCLKFRALLQGASRRLLEVIQICHKLHTRVQRLRGIKL
jgi:hypothetical protein